MSIQLSVNIVNNNRKVTIRVEKSIIIFDLCREIRSKIHNVNDFGPETEYGIFLPDPDPRQSYWLESSRNLSYYSLKDRTEVEYRFKYRRLQIKTLDDTKKTLQVDDSKTVAELMIIICSKMGITNHEEYSLVRELDDDLKMKTMTMRKQNSLAKDYEKLEKLKQKLHTDDDLNWVSNSKNLRQQGIDESEVLQLRRKYFFSDQNVDARDPIQLNLLFVQLKNAIMDGAHPVTQDEAIQLAGIQCQVEFGPHIADKMKKMSIELKDYLPKEYVKIKSIEKKIFQYHQKLGGLTTMDAKVRYIHLCRSLKTYGITFFLVKERLKGKSKMAPRLFGITKESVMRVDERTKEIIQTWPLTTVRRWAATANLFTVDFGEYADSNYVIQTTEGEQIAQLISGYIDIIVKKKKKKDFVGIEGDEESAMYEDNVAPAKASIISHQRVDGGHIQTVSEGNVAIPGIVRSAEGQSSYYQGAMAPGTQVVIRGTGGAVGQAHINQNTQQFQMRNLDQPKRALVARIEDNIKVIQSAQNGLEGEIEMTEVGEDAASNRWRQKSLQMARMGLSSSLGAMNNATGGLVTMISPDISSGDESDSVDYSQINTVVSTIGMHVTEFMSNVRQVCQLGDGNREDQGKLLGAARSLAFAFQELLTATQPSESGEDPSRKAILEAANKVGESSRELVEISTAKDKALEEEWAYKDELLVKAKRVANAAAGLVIGSKSAATALAGDETGAQTRLVGAAKGVGIATSRLVTSAKVLVWSIEQSSSQQQLISACKNVNRAVDDVRRASQPVNERDPKVFNDSMMASAAVQEAVGSLLDHVQRGSVQARQDPVIENLLSAGECLPQCLGDGVAMVRQAQILAKAASQLAAALKQKGIMLAEQGDLDGQQECFRAAVTLAEATAKLIKSAKACTADDNESNSQERQQELLRDARNLLSVINASSTLGMIRTKVSNGLEVAGRAAVISAGQLVTTSQEAAKKSRGSNYQICQDAGEMKDKVLPRVAMACAEVRNRPEDPICQSDLLQACQQLSQCFDQLVKSCQALCPTVRDPSIQSALSASLNQSQASAGDLMHCVSRAENVLTGDGITCMGGYGEGAVGGRGALESSVERLRRLQEELNRTQQANDLVPLPGEKLADSGYQVGTGVRDVGASVHHLIAYLTGQAGAPGEGPVRERMDRLAAEVAMGMGGLVQGLRGLAACRDTTCDEDLESRNAALESAKQVAHQCELLVQQIGTSLDASGSGVQDGNNNNLIQMSEQLSLALTNCLSHIPGHREVDQLYSKMTRRSHQLVVPKKPTPSPSADTSPQQTVDIDDSYMQNLQTQFREAAEGFNQVVVQIASGEPEPLKVSHLTIQLSGHYDRLMDAGEALMTALPTIIEEDEEGDEPTYNLGMTASSNDVYSGLRDVTNRSVDLMQLLKGALSTASQDEGRLKHSLWQAAGAVSESVNQLLTSCTITESPSRKRVDTSHRQLDSVKATIAVPPTQPLSNDSYYSCLDTIDNLTQELNHSLETIPVVAKDQNPNKLCDAIKVLTDATCKVITTSTQAAYLVGVSDPRSDPGKAGIEHHLEPLKQHQAAIHDAYAVVANPEMEDKKAREYANVMGKKTTEACQLFRQIVAQNNNPVTKRQLVDAVKDVAQAASSLITTVRGTSSISPLDDESAANQRALWTEKAGHVVHSVDNAIDLVSSSRDTNSQCARIASEAHEIQQPIMTASQVVLAEADQVVKAAASLADNNQSEAAEKSYHSSSITFTLSVKKLYDTVKECDPGQQICNEAQLELSHLLKALDQASISAAEGSLTNYSSPGDVSQENTTNFLQLMTSSVVQISGQINNLMAVGRTDRVERLSHGVTQLASYMQPLVQAAISSASCLRRSKDQNDILEFTKTTLEATSQLISSLNKTSPLAKGMTPEQKNSELEESGNGLREICEEVTAFLNQLSTRQGDLDNVVETINNACTKLDRPVGTPSATPNFAACQTRLVQHSRSLTSACPDLLSLASSLQHRSSISEITFHEGSGRSIAGVASGMAQEFTKLSAAAQDIQLCLVGSPQLALKIKQAVQSLGQATVDLVRYQLPDQSRVMTERVATLMSALQASACGTQACIRAQGEVTAIVADLETSAMFAVSGTLTSDVVEASGDVNKANLETLRNSIESGVDSLCREMEEVMKANSQPGGVLSQEDVSRIAHSCLGKLQVVSEAAKLVAIRLGPQQSAAQVSLINSAKDVALSLSSYLEWAKTSAGRCLEVDDVATLKSRSLQFIASSRTLSKTVQTVEDESLRGTRALKSALEAMMKDGNLLDQWNPWNTDADSISAEMAKGTLDSGVGSLSSLVGGPDTPVGVASPDDLINATKTLVAATAKAVTAANSTKQDDLMLAANTGRKAITDLSRHLYSSLSHYARRTPDSEDEDEAVTRQAVDKTLESGRDGVKYLIELFKFLLQTIQEGKGSPAKLQVTLTSKKVAQAVHELTNSASTLKSTNMVDPTDAATLAEEELLGAANQIEAAARKLAMLKPRAVVKVTEVDESLSFDDQILSAAQLIVSATSALLKAATESQQELVAQGRIRPGDANVNESEETQWSQGLTSAARMVAAATHNLCESANALVQGSPGAPERLVSSSKQVAASTAQLLVACMVKSDPGCPSMRRLQTAGGAVKRATEALVKEAQSAFSGDTRVEEESAVGADGTRVNKSMVQSMRQLIQTQADILAKENELKSLRNRLTNIRHEHIRTNPEYFDEDEGKN